MKITIFLKMYQKTIFEKDRLQNNIHVAQALGC